MHKNSCEAGMQKMENFAEDILENLTKILVIYLVSHQLNLLKNKMSSMLANQSYVFKRMSYTMAAYQLQYYLVLTMTIYTRIMVVVCVFH